MRMSTSEAAMPVRLPKGSIMANEHRSDRFTAVEDQYAGYTVYDHSDQRIVNASQPKYVTGIRATCPLAVDDEPRAVPFRLAACAVDPAFTPGSLS